MPLLKVYDIEMSGASDKDDSELSQAGSIVGILTFAIALIGALWLWLSRAWKALEELRAVKSTRGWHEKEMAWLDTSIKVDANRPHQPCHIATADKIRDLQADLHLPDHAKLLYSQKMKAMDMARLLSKELQILDAKLDKLPGIPLRSATNLSEQRRNATTSGRVGDPDVLVHLSGAIFEDMTVAAKISTFRRFLWLPFRSDALETIKHMEEMMSTLRFVQLATMDVRVADNELRAATHEKLLLEILEVVKEVKEAQHGTVGSPALRQELLLAAAMVALQMEHRDDRLLGSSIL